MTLLRSMTVGIASVLLLTSCRTNTSPAQPGMDVPLATTNEQQISDAITAISTFPSELAPQVWVDGQLSDELRSRALEVVHHNLEQLGMSSVVVDDIQLQGSISSYEYDSAADFGVHVFTHDPGLTLAQLKPLLKIFNSYLNVSQEPQLSFYGYPVEVSFWATEDPHAAAGDGIPVYSIQNDAWITRPSAQPDNFNREHMLTDAIGFVSQYNTLASEYAAGKIGFECSRIEAFADSLKDYRAAAFDAGEGSRSTGNLTYRALRRLNINIPDTLDALEDDCTFVNESVY